MSALPSISGDLCLVASLALAAVACDGTSGARSSPSSGHAAPPVTVSSPASSTASASATQSPALAQSSAAAQPADEGSFDFEATILSDARIGRPSGDVVVVQNDPRYQLRIRVERVDQQGAADFPVGREVTLGIHSPTRTFPSGVPVGNRVHLRAHWRLRDDGRRGFYHLKQLRDARAK